MYARRAHTFSKAMEDRPCTPSEETYHHELWEEIPGFYNNRMTDEEFEIFSRLDGGVRVGSLGPAEEVYTQADHAARYFNDEDLYQHSEEEYDYPRGVEDEDDAYMWSDEFEVDECFDESEDFWPSSRDDEVRDSPLDHGEPIMDAQYFDANDLYDPEKGRDHHRNPPATGGMPWKHDEGLVRETSTVWGEHLHQWPRRFVEVTSPVQTRHEWGLYTHTSSFYFGPIKGVWHGSSYLQHLLRLQPELSF